MMMRQAFDRTRPVCPLQLFDDLVSLAGMVPCDRVAEKSHATAAS
jgi:hypothetical protein